VLEGIGLNIGQQIIKHVVVTWLGHNGLVSAHDADLAAHCRCPAPNC
jgi:hypothetical protein